LGKGLTKLLSVEVVVAEGGTDQPLPESILKSLAEGTCNLLLGATFLLPANQLPVNACVAWGLQLRAARTVDTIHQEMMIFGIACCGRSEGRAFAEPLFARARGRCCEIVMQRILEETKLGKVSQRQQVTNSTDTKKLPMHEKSKS